MPRCRSTAQRPPPRRAPEHPHKLWTVKPTSSSPRGDGPYFMQRRAKRCGRLAVSLVALLAACSSATTGGVPGAGGSSGSGGDSAAMRAGASGSGAVSAAGAGGSAAGGGGGTRTDVNPGNTAGATGVSGRGGSNAGGSAGARDAGALDAGAKFRDASTSQAARTADGKALLCLPDFVDDAGQHRTANDNICPGVCAHWCGDSVPYPGGIDALPNCPAAITGDRYSIHTCEEWCGCWFGKGYVGRDNCSTFFGVDNDKPTCKGSPTKGLLETAGECLAMCREEIGEPITSDESYRLTAATFHCESAIPQGLCTGPTSVGR